MKAEKRNFAFPQFFRMSFALRQSCIISAFAFSRWKYSTKILQSFQYFFVVSESYSLIHQQNTQAVKGYQEATTGAETVCRWSDFVFGAASLF